MIPSAMVIESAIDALRRESPEAKQARLKEFRIAIAPQCLPAIEQAYLLGLKTAEVMAAQELPLKVTT